MIGLQSEPEDTQTVRNYFQYMWGLKSPPIGDQMSWIATLKRNKSFRRPKNVPVWNVVAESKEDTLELLVVTEDTRYTVSLNEDHILQIKEALERRGL